VASDFVKALTNAFLHAKAATAFSAS